METQAKVDTLSDLAFRQSILIKGLISFSVDALSDTFGDVEKAIYIRGLELSKDSSQQLIMEKKDAKEINLSHPQTEDSSAIQLDRSSFSQA